MYGLIINLTSYHNSILVVCQLNNVNFLGFLLFEVTVILYLKEAVLSIKIVNRFSFILKLILISSKSMVQPLISIVTLTLLNEIVLLNNEDRWACKLLRLLLDINLTYLQPGMEVEELSSHKLHNLMTKYLISYHKANLSILKDLHNREFQFEYKVTHFWLLLIHLNHPISHNLLEIGIHQHSRIIIILLP